MEEPETQRETNLQALSLLKLSALKGSVQLSEGFQAGEQKIQSNFTIELFSSYYYNLRILDTVWILDLYQIWFAKISSHSVGCLFTLLIVSFET